MVEARTRRLLDILITPNASMSVKHGKRLCVVIAIIGLVMGLVFLSLGAWPVLGFMGLEIFLFVVLFRLFQRKATRFERVVMTAEEVRIEKGQDEQVQSESKFSPQLAHVESTDGKQLALVSGKKRVSFGGWLSSLERSSLFDLLQRALMKSKR